MSDTLEVGHAVALTRKPDAASLRCYVGEALGRGGR